jgi:hypothetical protein
VPGPPATPARPPAPPSGADPVDAAERYLAHGPSVAWGGSSQFGAAGRVGRLALQRVLRPHLVREMEFDAAVVAALREADRRILAVEALLSGRLEELISGVSERLDDHAERIGRLESALAEARGFAAARIGELVGRLGEAEEAAQAADERRAAARAEVAERVRALGRRVAELERRLAADPQLSEPSLLVTLDDQGREAIGFRAGERNGEAAIALSALIDGSEEAVRERRRGLVAHLAGRGRVVDLACGRGELLDVLAEAGLSGRGAEADPALMARCRQKRHAVECAEPIPYLAAQADGSIEALAAAGLLERLSYPEIGRLLALARAKLAPGGALVVQARNPRPLEALARSAADPRRRAALLPEVLVALLRSHGFDSALVSFPSGSGVLREDRQSQPDYAAVATVGA